jgi:hypothetical protein
VSRENGERSAYPQKEREKWRDRLGLSKREYFAGLAMQGALGGAPGSHLQPQQLARESVAHADALLAALEKAP